MRACIGVSTFGETPNLVGPDHLAHLFEHALGVVPADEVEHTPLFLLATAGMRLLPEMQRKALLDEICSYARRSTKFQLPDCGLHVQVIPGETEGLYGWIAANYLLGGFDAPEAHDHGKGHHTYGFLDMGGASAQIAFAPNATEAEKHADDLKLLRMRTLDGAPSEYRVFVTTWLGFGVHEARRRYVDTLLASSDDKVKELPDPCLPAGLTVARDGTILGHDAEKGQTRETHLLGTGKFLECLRQTYPLLDKDAPCEDTPCLLHGVHVPAIDFDVNHFVGVSEYWHTTHEVFEMGHKDSSYDFHTYQKRVLEFCTQKWSNVLEGINNTKWGKKVDRETAAEVCFKASWLINMLHDGIGVPRVGLEHIGDHGYNGTKAVLDQVRKKVYMDPFQAVNKIDGTEVSWTLGKMVLYASSQIPPSESTLAVGFGSNEPGMPKDFQYAGGTQLHLADDLTNDDDNDDWNDLFTSNPQRGIPSLLVLILIVAVISILCCGRDRRKTLRRKLATLLNRGPPGSKKRRGGGLGAKLFSHGSGPAYERVLEEGAAGPAAATFELAEVDSDNDNSDSSEGSCRLGKTSGWATPRIVAAEKPGQSYFDSVVTQGVGLGLGPPSVFGNAMDRGGLMSRTESRERLGSSAGSVSGSGYRSRAASPSKMLRSPLIAQRKESVD